MILFFIKNNNYPITNLDTELSARGILKLHMLLQKTKRKKKTRTKIKYLKLKYIYIYMVIYFNEIKT